MDNYMFLFNNLMALVLLVVWFSIMLMMIIGLSLGKIYEKRFYIAVSKLLSGKSYKLDDCVNSVKNNYEVYRRHRFGFANKKIVPICQEFASKLRIGIGLDSIQNLYNNEMADRLEEVIKQLQYEEHFDDEKANEIIEDLNGKINNEIVEQVKQKLVFLEAYHKGIVSVKDLEISELKYKIQKKNWATWITGIIGVTGSVASIISIFM